MSLIWPIVRRALTSPKRVAVVDDHQQLTYGRLVGGAMFLAHQIETVTSDRHVGLLLPTSGAFPLALLAAWLAKRVAVPFNYLLAQDELSYVIADSGIDTIVTVGPMIEFLGGRHMIPAHIRLLRLEDVDFTGFPPLRWPPRPASDNLAVILYTSGTSGRPKGVMLTHGNLQANVQDCITHANITLRDKFLGVLPQFHSFGLTALTLLPLAAGCQVVYTARFVPRKVVELIRKHRPGITMGVPSMYGALLSVKGVAPEDFTSIHCAISGGEPLPRETLDQVRDRFGLEILEGYGLTETSPVTHWSTPDRHRTGSVGLPLPHVTQIILDESDRPLPPNQDGEIVVAGPNVMAGYYKLPNETAQAFVDLDVCLLDGRKFRGTAFRTGDIGHVDDDGYLYITGRKKEMLIVGGENVFPREIEEVLNHHPSVRDSAVIAKEDGMRGQVPVAFVEVQEGETFDESALRAWCRDRLASYKVPRQITPIDQLPRSATGKILRRKLKTPQ